MTQSMHRLPTLLARAAVALAMISAATHSTGLPDLGGSLPREVAVDPDSTGSLPMSAAADAAFNHESTPEIGPDGGGELPRWMSDGGDGGGRLPSKLMSCDGAGSLPKPPRSMASALGAAAAAHAAFAHRSQGLVIDAARQDPLPDVLIVVTNGLGEVVAAGMSDVAGRFLVLLPDAPGLELVIPSLGLAGIEIETGDSLLILVP